MGKIYPILGKRRRRRGLVLGPLEELIEKLSKRERAPKSRRKSNILPFDRDLTKSA